MLFHNRYRAQAVVCRAPFDGARGAVGGSNHGAVKQGEKTCSKARRDPLLDSNGKSTCGSVDPLLSKGLRNPEKLDRKKKNKADNVEVGAARSLDRYRLQRHAAKILGWPKALSGCEYARQHGAAGVEVWRNTSADRGSWSRYRGLQTCKSVWNCPVCSNRRAWNRRGDLQKLVDYANKQGLTLVMLTLTSSHDLSTSLSEQKRMMKKAKASLTSRAPFKKGLLRHMVGSVTATEVTHGQWTGWHQHFHYIVVLNLRHLPFHKREEEARRLGEMAWPAWQGAATNSGLHVARQGWSVDVGAAVAAYPTDKDKIEGGWTLADEATRGAAKKGAGRHPFELLRLSCDADDASARELFIEYVDAMRNVRALVWSRGLAELVGVNKDDDDQGEGDEANEEAAEVTEEHTGTLDKKEWQGSMTRPGVRSRRGRMAVAVSRAGVAGFEQERDNGKRDPHAEDQAKVLIELGVKDPAADVIDLDDDKDSAALSYYAKIDAETDRFLDAILDVQKEWSGAVDNKPPP